MLEQMVEPDSKLLLSTSFTEVHRSVIKFQLRTAPYSRTFMRVMHSHDLYWTGTTRPRCSITIYVCSISPDTCSSRWSHRQFRRIIVIIIDMRLLIKCQVQSVIRKNKTSVDWNISILCRYTFFNGSQHTKILITDHTWSKCKKRYVACYLVLKKVRIFVFFFFFFQSRVSDVNFSANSCDRS